MELALLIHLGDVNDLIDSEDKYNSREYDSREFGILKESQGGLDCGIKSGATFFILLIYHLYYMAKIPQMLFGDISNFINYLTNIPEAFGEFWSIIKMNFID